MPYTKGQRANLQGREVEIIQADADGKRYVVRILDTGSALPVLDSQLSPSTNPAPTAPTPVLVAPPLLPDPPVARSPAKMLAADIQAWKLTDGFGFHNLMKRADDGGFLDQTALARDRGVSVSSVRNWINGSLRPPPQSQRSILNAVLAGLGAADMKRELETQEKEEDRFLRGERPEPKLTGPDEDLTPRRGGGLEAALAAAQGQAEQQFIDVKGRTLTVQYTVTEGVWNAEIAELPGLKATGDTKLEALFDVKALAIDRIEKTKR